MFRAMTWWMSAPGRRRPRPRRRRGPGGGARDRLGTDPTAPTIAVDGTDVAVAIRQEDVNAAVSPVSAVPEVRARLLALQREVIAADGGIVVEGRDIGSVVVPDAPVKVYLSADPGGAGRARRTARRADALTSRRPAPRCSRGTRSTPAGRPRP